MSEHGELALAAGKLRLALSPSVGGAISAFAWIDGGIPCAILRKCHNPLEKVLDAASFPLVPYVNRIRDGQFSFGGGTCGSRRTWPATRARFMARVGSVRGR